MIFAYPVRVCLECGQVPQLRVTGNRADLAPVHFRWGARVDRVNDTARPGVYVAAFDGGVMPGQLDARCARALYVVRDPRSNARLLVVLPLFTYHAYNVAEVDGTRGEGEGECLYSGAQWVSLQRPGGGIGGHPWDEVHVDAYDPDSPRQTFAHWDAKAIAWLENNHYGFDVCTDVELHDRAFDLSRYRAIVSFGHHEYWTESMRARVDAFIAGGGNVAFFGGNTCWFRTVYDAQGQRIRRDGRWSENPEWRTTGVSYAYGGGKWIGERPATGYSVIGPSHWIFAGLQVRSGEVFGERERLIGYECDGAPPQSGMEILAEASIAAWPVHDGSGEISQTARATMILRDASAGMVFSASTVDWARVLAQGNRIVHGVTRNVLDRFLAGSQR